MAQLREVGWVHHLARHAIACFLTRGDLWISWEEGLKVSHLLSDLFARTEYCTVIPVLSDHMKQDIMFGFSDRWLLISE